MKSREGKKGKAEKTLEGLPSISEHRASEIAREKTVHALNIAGNNPYAEENRSARLVASKKASDKLAETWEQTARDLAKKLDKPNAGRPTNDIAKMRVKEYLIQCKGSPSHSDYKRWHIHVRKFSEGPYGSTAYHHHAKTIKEGLKKH